jgi:hypothetical protein
VKLGRGISKIDWLQPAVISLLLANLVPVFGVLLFHWEIFPLMFLFWSENVIIGLVNVLKMLTANPESPISWAAKLFFIPFFSLHYGLFTFVHGIFVIAFFGGAKGRSMGFPDLGTFWNIMMENRLGGAVLGLAISRGISFAMNYLGKGEYTRAHLQQLMAQPYGRIVVMHLTILGGGFLMLALHSPVAGLLLLVLLKTALDLHGHFAERREFAESAGAEIS